MPTKARVDLSSEIFLSPAYWSPTLNILFVIDGRINTGKGQFSFGLGYVLETLRAPGSWVQLNVKVVRRDLGVFQGGASDDTNYTADGSPPIFNFKFTPESLDSWDQVWLFADYPANEPDDYTAGRFSPLRDDELKCLAEWMDSGGGVFAAGDHWNLGASMCSRIPRVRSMRRWTPAQDVPPMDGDARHQTLQPNPLTQDQMFEEGDTYAQPIEVVQWRVSASDLVRPTLPHAVLATPTGAIETFPDHMHEGEVIDDDKVELDKPLDISGYDRPEYPLAQFTISTTSTARVLGTDVFPRPRPHVAAYGRTTNPYPPPYSALATPDAAINTLYTKRFGLIGTYDGDGAKIGRVVVESTWHHWFSLNLAGFKAEVPDTQYQLMQTYYRNVAIWLATPAQRQLMLSGLTWRTVVTDPMAFPLDPPRSLWAVGERAVSVISRAVSQSMLFDFVASMFGGQSSPIFGVPRSVDASEPFSESVSVGLALRAIVGGIASSFIKPAHDTVSGGPRTLLDRSAIERGFAEGVQQGYRALVGAIESRAASAKVGVARLEGAFKPASPAVPVVLTKVRVIAERLQFPDPTDPALITVSAPSKGGSSSVSITLRVMLGSAVVANEVVDDLALPTFQPAGAIVALDRVLYAGEVQNGETLSVDVLTGNAQPGRVEAERVRFTDALGGDPLGWVGAHVPTRSQPWRLWYRIEVER